MTRRNSSSSTLSTSSHTPSSSQETIPTQGPCSELTRASSSSSLAPSFSCSDTLINPPTGFLFPPSSSVCSTTVIVVSGEISSDFNCSAIEALESALAWTMIEYEWEDESESGRMEDSSIFLPENELQSEQEEQEGAGQGADQLQDHDDDDDASTISPLTFVEEDFWADSERLSKNSSSSSSSVRKSLPRRRPFPPLSTLMDDTSSQTQSLSDELSTTSNIHSYSPRHPKVHNRLLKNRTRFPKEKATQPSRPCSCLIDYDATSTTSSSEEEGEAVMQHGVKVGNIIKKKSLFLAGATVRGRGIF